MHLHLAGSLEHVCERATASSLDLSGAARLAAGIRAGERFGPAAFGWYYELVFAILGDDPEQAACAAGALSSLKAAASPLTLATLDSQDVEDRRALYLRRMGPETEGWFHPPAAEHIATFNDRFEQGFELLAKAAPDLADEIGGLVREIVLASGDPNSVMQFDGGSAYQLWGLLFLNPAFHPTPVAMAEVLAHESGHLLLFGFTVDEPLVLNGDDELFESPLRVDRRPMDGIFHATYVSARMTWTMRRLAEERSLDSATRDAARQAAESDVENFRMGDGVIQAHGRLSDTGQALIAAARQYMGAL